MPKFNMYQSLHTTVIGPEGKPVELQIRTHAMHRRAEYGIAAHWKYKENDVQPVRPPAQEGGDKDGGDDMAWLRQLLDWQKETADPGEFLESLRFDLHGAEVYVFTPKGDVIALPADATPGRLRLRRAHRGRPPMHRRPGQRAAGAAREHARQRRRRRDLHLQGARTPGPSRDWLAFVQIPRARNKIRQWFAKERREDAIEDGKEAISRAMRKQGLPLQRLLADDALIDARPRPALRRRLRAVRRGRRGARVGPDRRSAAGAVDGRRRGRGRGPRRDRRTRPQPARSAVRRATPASWSRARPTSGSSWRAAARRCRATRSWASSPAATASRCTAATASTSTSLAQSSPTAWSRSSGRRPSRSVFLVAIQVEALDRTRLLSDVTRVLSDQHVNILSASVTTTRDRVAVNRFTFEMGDPKHLGHVLQRGAQRRGRLRRLPRHQRQERLTRRHFRSLAPARRSAAPPPLRRLRVRDGLSRRPAAAVAGVDSRGCRTGTGRTGQRKAVRKVPVRQGDGPQLRQGSAMAANPGAAAEVAVRGVPRRAASPHRDVRPTSHRRTQVAAR